MKADGIGGGNYSHYGVAMPGIDDLLAKALNTTDFEDYVAPAARSSCRSSATCR